MLKSATSRDTKPACRSLAPANHEPAAGRRPGTPLKALHQSFGNQAVLRMLARQAQRPAAEIAEKVVDSAQAGGNPLIDEQTAPASGSNPPPAAPLAPRAGIEYFTVSWQKNPQAGPYNARLKLHYLAKFRDDGVHDPQCAEFRQNAMATYECTAGTHKGDKADTSPLHDDHYSRDDDLKKRPRTSADFESEDNPGVKRGHTEPDDVIDFNFTAEQMIVDICQTPNKVIAHIGPNSARITGADPRNYSNVPDIFEIFG
jgi:hypothetical protein